MRIIFIWFKMNINSACNMPCAKSSIRRWCTAASSCLFTIDSPNEHVRELTHICRWMIKWITHSIRMISRVKEFHRKENESRSIWNANRRNYKIGWNVGDFFVREKINGKKVIKSFKQIMTKWQSGVKSRWIDVPIHMICQ